MKIADVIARVAEHHVKEYGSSDVLDQELADIVGWSLREIGLEVDGAGEIYDPAPAPPAVLFPTVPAMNRVRYGGRKRR